MATELAKAYVQIVPSAQGIQGSISSVLSGESASAGNQAGENIAGSLAKKLKSTLVGLGIGKMVMDAVGNASEFETSMAKVSTLFSGNEKQFADLQADILNLSSAYGLGATTLAEAAYSAESAGVPMEQLTEMLSGSAQLAVAGFTDIDTALSATAKTMNAYGDAAGSVEDIQKILIQTQNLGITTVGELGASLANVTPTAAAMGVGFDQVGAALAQLTANGVPTAQATTQLRSAMTELGKAGTQADKSFRKAAKGTQFAGMSFQEAIASGANLGDVFGLMQKYADASGLSMVDLWGSVEAGNAAMAIAGDVDKFNNNLKQMSTQSDVVGDAYGKMANTFGTSMNRLKESATNFMTTLFQGGDISASFDQLLGSVGDVGEKLIGWITTGLTTLGENLPAMMSSLMDFAGSLLTALGKVDWIEIGTTIITGIVGALGEFGTRIIGLFSDAVNSVTSGEVDFASIGQSIWNGVTSIITTAGDWLQTLFNTAKDAAAGIDFSGIGSKILDGITSFLGQAGEFLGTIFEGGIKAAETQDWPSLGDAIKTGVNLVLNGGAFLSEIFNAGAELVKAINWTNVGEHAEELIVNGLAGAATLVSTISKAADQLLTGIDWTGIGQGASDLMKTGLEGASKTLEAGFTAAHDFIMAINWGEVGSAVQGGLGDVWSGFTGFLGDVLSGAGDAVAGVGAGIGAAAEGAGKAIARLFNGDDAKQAAADLSLAMEDLNSSLEEGKKNLENASKNIGACIRNSIADELSTSNMNSLGSVAMTDILAGCTITEQDLDDGVAAIASSAAEKFKSSGGWIDVGKNIITGIISGINAASETLITKMKDLAGTALTAAKEALGIESPSTVMRDQVGKWIPAGIAEGIAQNGDIVGEAMQDMSDELAAADISGIAVRQGRSLGGISGTETGSEESNVGIISAIQGLRNDMRNIRLMVGKKVFGQAVVDYGGDRLSSYIGEVEGREASGYGT